MAFHPYLNFGGNCREAFTRYQEIFGGQLDVMPMSEVPGDFEYPAGHADLLAHAALTVDGHVLMASDDPSPDFQPPRGMYVNYSVTDPSEAERVFAALADGGRVEMPIEETFWALRFGICVDRFGTPWMVNAERPQDT